MVYHQTFKGAIISSHSLKICTGSPPLPHHQYVTPSPPPICRPLPTTTVTPSPPSLCQPLPTINMSSPLHHPHHQYVTHPLQLCQPLPTISMSPSLQLCHPPPHHQYVTPLPSSICNPSLHNQQYVTPLPTTNSMSPSPHHHYVNPSPPSICQLTPPPRPRTVNRVYFAQ